MRILFIVPSYKPAYIYGGPVIAVSRLAECLAQLGHEVTVYTTTANGNAELDVPANKPVMQDGVTVWYFRRITGDHTHISPTLWWRTWLTIKKFDTVHIHSWWNLLVLGAALICRLRRVKPLLSPHGMFCDYVVNKRNPRKKQLLHRLIGKRLLKYSYLHVTSLMEWKECLDLLPSWKGGMISYLVGLPGNHYSRTNNDVFTISFLSRVDPKKGLDILLQALAGLPIQYRLRIAGTGKTAYISKLKRLISTLNIADKVEWVGWKSYEEKFSFLAASDLLALTSHNENFAIVVVESLHAGTPVLVSKHVGLSDYVHQRKLGWVTAIERVEQVQEKLKEAYLSHEERARISREARTIILGDFNDVRLAGEYLELYEKCRRGFGARRHSTLV
jgi:glycosyltransferase involved in cell wall biosynthesis